MLFARQSVASTSPPNDALSTADDPVIHWPLAGDPAIRWQVMRDLLAAPAAKGAAERGWVAATGHSSPSPPDGTITCSAGWTICGAPRDAGRA